MASLSMLDGFPPPAPDEAAAVVAMSALATREASPRELANLDSGSVERPYGPLEIPPVVEVLWLVVLR